MTLKNRTTMLSFMFLILHSSITSATYLVSHEDAKLDLPILAEFHTENAMMCIHRCLAHSFCNIANVNESSIYHVACIFAYLKKGYKLKKHLTEKKGWYAYEFLEMVSKVLILCLK